MTDRRAENLTIFVFFAFTNPTEILHQKQSFTYHTFYILRNQKLKNNDALSIPNL